MDLMIELVIILATASHSFAILAFTETLSKLNNLVIVFISDL
jgi:hypothetical protein